MSVVVAAYNEQRWLADCLASLAAQTFHDFELVLVDDGSTDATAAIAASAGARVVRTPHRGTGAARDAGAAAAGGKLLVFLDADELYAPEFLARLVTPLADASVRGTFPGGIEWHNPDDGLAPAWLRIHGYPDGRRVVRGDTHPYPKALRREDFVAAGGYPLVGHGEDFAFGRRVGPAVVVPDARYRFTLPTGTREVLAKSRWIGRGLNFECVRPPLWQLVPPWLLVRAARWLLRGHPRAAYVQLLYDVGTLTGLVESRLRSGLRNVA